jgi:hypothetical protein
LARVWRASCGQGTPGTDVGGERRFRSNEWLRTGNLREQERQVAKGSSGKHKKKRSADDIHELLKSKKQRRKRACLGMMMMM